MVYMEDSRRAAEIARSEGMPVGLHLNVSEILTAPDVPSVVRERHARLVRIFWRMKLMRWVNCPGIQGLVTACVEDQYQGFLDTYGHEPTHWDGPLPRSLPECPCSRRDSERSTRCARASRSVPESDRPSTAQCAPFRTLSSKPPPDHRSRLAAERDDQAPRRCPSRGPGRSNRPSRVASPAGRS